MIPRTLHQVWVGPKPIPEKLLGMARTWAAFHRGWDRILWTDRPEAHAPEWGGWTQVIKTPELVNEGLVRHLDEFCHAGSKWAALSDLIRYDVVTTQGGVYADMDVEAFESIDDVVDGVTLFNADEWWNRPGNYLFGAVRNHAAMWMTVTAQENRFREAFQADKAERERCARWWAFWRTPKRDRLLPTSPVWLTGPVYFNAIIRRWYDCVILPPKLYSCLDVDWRPEQVRNWPQRAMGLHHFGGDHPGSWYTRKRKCPDAAFRGDEPCKCRGCGGGGHEHA